MSIREPPRDKGRTLGRWPNVSKDGRVPMAQTPARGQFEFVDWTEDNHLRHSRFVALSDDKKATGVKRK
jgi:hypothetical protein